MQRHTYKRHAITHIPHMLYNTYILPLAMPPWNHVKVVCDAQLCYVSITLLKVKRASLGVKTSWLWRKSSARTSRSPCTPKHSFILTGIHWRIGLEEILMCVVINWNKWKNLPYIQTKFASPAADAPALNVSQLVEKFHMAAALTSLPVWQLHF